MTSNILMAMTAFTIVAYTIGPEWGLLAIAVYTTIRVYKEYTG